jgi:hypothetical protein
MVLFVLLLAAVPAFAQLPGFYKSVDRIVWVVDDVDRTVSAWNKTGLFNARENDVVELPVRYREAMVSSRMRWVVGRLGDQIVDFVQPLDGADAYADFARRHRSGIFALVHRVPSQDAFRAEIKRLEALGVNRFRAAAIRTATSSTCSSTPSRRASTPSACFGLPVRTRKGRCVRRNRSRAPRLSRNTLLQCGTLPPFRNIGPGSAGLR